MGKKVKMGMIGGGKGAFIGRVHRMAAAFDSKIDLVCGVFSSDPAKSLESGLDLGLDASRIYTSYQEMIETESRLPLDVRMDFVPIVTPNHVHFAPSKMALEFGFHVVCDKPMTFNLEEAYEREFERRDAIARLANDIVAVVAQDASQQCPRQIAIVNEQDSRFG